jgi:2'-5' RNA ligase
MAVAITLRLDAITPTKIDMMLEALPDRRADIRHRHRPYSPHIKLATYSDGVDIADLDAALATATGTWQKLPITLAGFGIFPGEVPTIWLAPVPTTDLLMRHATLHRSLADLSTHSNVSLRRRPPGQAWANSRTL